MCVVTATLLFLEALEALRGKSSHNQVAKAIIEANSFILNDFFSILFFPPRLCGDGRFGMKLSDRVPKVR